MHGGSPPFHFDFFARRMSRSVCWCAGSGTRLPIINCHRGRARLRRWTSRRSRPWNWQKLPRYGSPGRGRRTARAGRGPPLRPKLNDRRLAPRLVRRNQRREQARRLCDLMGLAWGKITPVCLGMSTGDTNASAVGKRGAPPPTARGQVTRGKKKRRRRARITLELCARESAVGYVPQAHS